MKSKKLNIILIGNICVVLWITSIISQKLWITAIVAILVGVLVLKYRKILTETAVSDEGTLAKNIPVTVTLQRKGFAFALPLMGYSFILIGILLLLQSL